jgi:hypothetical protein
MVTIWGATDEVRRPRVPKHENPDCLSIILDALSLRLVELRTTKWWSQTRTPLLRERDV